MPTLYNISNITHSGSSFSAEVTFDPSHSVFAGHFPGQPVVPGVYLLEILRDVISKVTGKAATIREASVIKFLQVIDPVKTSGVSIEGTMQTVEDHFRIDAMIRQGEMVFVKFKGIGVGAGNRA